MTQTADLDQTDPMWRGIQVGHVYRAIMSGQSLWVVTDLKNRNGMPHATLVNQSDNSTLKTVSIWTLKNVSQFRLV